MSLLIDSANKQHKTFDGIIMDNFVDIQLIAT